MLRKIVLAGSFSTFILAGIMLHAFVFDCEPLSIEKHYEIEKDVFNHSDLSHYGEFPNFADWCAEQNRKEERYHEWLANIADKVGDSAIAAFEWNVGQAIQNTREGSAAEAPAFEFNQDNR